MTREEIMRLSRERDEAREAYYIARAERGRATIAAAESLRHHRKATDARADAKRQSDEAWHRYRELDRAVQAAVVGMRGAR